MTAVLVGENDPIADVNDDSTRRHSRRCARVEMGDLGELHQTEADLGRGGARRGRSRKRDRYKRGNDDSLQGLRATKLSHIFLRVTCGGGRRFPQAPSIASRTAPIVASTSSSVWASVTNMTSICEGGRWMPRSTIAQ